MCAVGGLEGEMKFGGGEAEDRHVLSLLRFQVCIQLKKTATEIWFIFLNAAPPVETKDV